MLKSEKVGQAFLPSLRVHIWVGLTLFCFLLQGCGPKLTTEQYLQRAKSAIAQGELNTAVIDLKNVLQSTPENGEARWLLGSIYVQLEDGVSAEKELRNAQLNGVADDSIEVLLARALFLQGRYDDLISEILPSSDLGPDYLAELLAVRGQAYIHMGKFERAQEELDKALYINDQTIAALVGHAMVNMASGQFGAVRDWLESALNIEPDHHQTWGLLARLEEMSGNFDAAEEGYTKAITDNVRPEKYLLMRALLRIQREQFDSAEDDLKKLPNSYFAKDYALGLIQFHQAQYRQAQNLFETALSKRADYAPAMYFLGISHFMQGHELQADNYLNNFLKLAPQSSSAAITLANLQMRRGDLSRAEALLSSVLARDAENKQALGLMAGALLIQGKQAEAIDIYQHLVSLEPDSTEALTKLGLALMAEGDVSLGAAQLEKAIALAPEEDKAQLALFLGFLNNGDKAEALAAAEQWVVNKPQNSSALLTLGWALLANGQAESARNAFEKVLAQSPGNPSAAHNLAVLAMQVGDINGAMAYYQDSLKSYPDHVGTTTALAHLHILIGQDRQAISLLESLWQSEPSRVPQAVLLGQALLREGRSERAQQVLTESRKADAENASLLSVLGAAQGENGHYAQAVDTFEHLVNLQTGSARNYYLLAQAYYQAGDAKGFASALQQSYRLNPNVLDTQIAMLGLLMQQKQLSKAQAIVSDMKTRYPDRAEVYVQSGRVLMAMKKPKESVKAYQKAHQLAPERSDILVNVALAQGRAGELDAAILTMETWLKKNPGDRVVTYNLANLYLLAGRKTQARRAFENILAINPDHVIALNNLASLLKDTDLPQALAYAERAYKLAPNTPSVADTLAMVLLAAGGQEERAIRLLEKAVRQAPGNPEISYNLAQALLANDEKQRAIDILKRLVGSKGEFPQKHQAGDLLADLGV